MLHAHERVLGKPEAQFGPVRTFVMGSSDHPNRTVLTSKLQDYLRWRNANAHRAHRLAKTGLAEARRAIGMLRDDALPGPERLAGLAAEFAGDTADRRSRDHCWR